MSTIADTKFKIINRKLYVPIVTLSSKDNAELVKLLESGYNRPVYWNEYQTKIETRNLDNNLQDFALMLLFKELEDYLFLFLTILKMVLKKSKEIVIQNIFSQE